MRAEYDHFPFAVVPCHCGWGIQHAAFFCRVGLGVSSSTCLPPSMAQTGGAGVFESIPPELIQSIAVWMPITNIFWWGVSSRFFANLLLSPCQFHFWRRLCIRESFDATGAMDKTYFIDNHMVVWGRCGKDVVLSDDKKTATHQSEDGGFATCLSKRGIKSGKKTWRVRFDSSRNFYGAVGVAFATYDNLDSEQVANTLGNSILYCNCLYPFHSVHSGGKSKSFKELDIIDVTLDFEKEKLLSWRRGEEILAQDPLPKTLLENPVEMVLAVVLSGSSVTLLLAAMTEASLFQSPE